MRPLVGVLVGIALVGLAGGAHAADPAPPQAAPQPAPSPPPPAWGQPLPPAPPPGWNGGAYPPPPPPPGYSPYGVPYAYPSGPGGAAYYYDMQKKNELLALVIEFFVPGVGSIYADHVAGAAVTWVLTIGGVVLAFWWIGQNIGGEDTIGNGTNNGPHDVWAIYVAVGAILTGRIYGLVDSYTSARDYNQRLRERLGIPDWSSFTLAPAPIRTDRAISWGPAVSFRF
jgi:TM2 domain-containing membrane protein YozV